MIPLDPKCLELLKVLIEAELPVSASSVSKELGLTSRIVHYRMEKIKIWLKNENITMSTKPGLGYRIEASNDEKLIIYNKISKESSTRDYYSSSDRLNLILLNLLTSDAPVTIGEIQVLLIVSRTTVTKDLQKAQLWLKKNQIQLIKKQNMGCGIEGPERNIRQALVSLIVEVVGEFNLLSYLGDSKGSSFLKIINTGQVLRGFGDYLETLRVRFFDEIVNFIEDVSHERFTDRAHILLALQIAVMTDRIQKNKLVKISESDIEILRSNSHFSQAVTIGEKILKSLNRKMTDGETAYLSLLLLNAEVRMPIVNQVLYRDTFENSSEKVKQIVEILLRHATLYLHPALWLDDELKDSLASHITRLMDSSKTNRSAKNLLLEDLKQIYPEIYKISTYGLVTLQELGFYAGEDEAGFITMYFAGAMERLRLPTFKKKKIVIVCNAGIATSKLLASRIQKEFPEIEIKDILSYLEYKNNKNNSSYDLVISTVPITSWEIPAVIVNPLLDNKDIVKIRSVINSFDTSLVDHESEFSYNTQYPLSSLLTLDTIKLQVAAENWEDVVDHAGLLLLKISAIEPRYIDAMKSLRLEHGPYMVIMPGIALLHAYPESGVKRLCMSMVTLLKPIPFGHQDFDPVYAAFALGAVDNNSHLRALSQLIEMLEDKSAVEVIKTTYLKARVLNIVSKYSGK